MGERTEPDYLAALRSQREIRDVASVDIQIEMATTGSAPLTLVRAAVAAKAKAAREQAEIDEVWCLFDVEWPRNHPHLNEAITLAAQNDIRLAVSNPCFEIWLALHFADHGAWVDNGGARQLRRKHDGQLDKGLNGSLYMPHRHAAAARAARLDERHRRDGTAFPDNNPSSGMHLLLASVERNGR
ncbi:RloB family protein [Paractinoplanes deccanensis]|uniref:RloB family protein n=1 Tax=Paractinoplanes deccanensis TaxID=113561 RepID=UPI001945A40E|nr:RloB family protein [Actinoplanes deccanensis]